MNRLQLESIKLGEPINFDHLNIDRIIIGIHLGWIVYEDGKEAFVTRDVAKILRYIRQSQSFERDGEIIAFE